MPPIHEVLPGFPQGWSLASQVDKKGGRVENVAGAGTNALRVTLRLLGLGGASEELRGDKLLEARAALGGAWLV